MRSTLINNIFPILVAVAIIGFAVYWQWGIMGLAAFSVIAVLSVVLVMSPDIRIEVNSSTPSQYNGPAAIGFAIPENVPGEAKILY